jgi:glycosyltransferase involved in cell wall biosynthesis
MTALHHLFFGLFPYPHGVAGTRHIQSYLTQFQLRGHPTSVMAIGASAVAADPREGFHEGTHYHTLLPSLFLRPADRAACRRALRFMRDRRQPGLPNVVVHYGVPDPRNLPYLLAIRKMGYRLIHWIVEDYASYSLRWARQNRMLVRALCIRWLDRLVPVLSDGVIVLSRRLEDKYAPRVRALARIPICIQRPRPNAARPPAVGPFRIVYVGTFGDKDGVTDLIEAYLLLRQQGGEGELVLVGGGAGAKACRARYEGQPGIRFTGYVPDEELERQLQDADLLCMTRVDDPYAHAGFPYKLGEYLATGNPVLATRVGDIEEYLRDGESAVIVPPGDRSAMAAAMHRMSGDRETARRIGTAGLASFEKTLRPR